MALRTNRTLQVLKLAREDEVGHVHDAEAAAFIIDALSLHGNSTLCVMEGCSADKVLSSLLDRNKRFRRRTIKAVVTLLCCRRFGDCAQLNAIAPQVVVSIAKHLLNTLGDPAWTQK